MKNEIPKFILLIVISVTGACVSSLEAKTFHYEIVYQENEELCRTAVNKINAYSKKRGSYKLKGMRENADLSVFNGIHWEPVPNVYHVYYSEFDINNDGVDEVVVNWVQGDNNSIYIYRKEKVDLFKITSVQYFFSDYNNMLGIIDLGKWQYILTELKEKPTSNYLNYRGNHNYYEIVYSFDIQFLKIDKKNYVLMTDGSNRSYEGIDPFDETVKKRREFLVLGKYKQGMLIARQTPQKEAMDDKCYFERIIN